jgi:hypothetical protein
LRHTFLFRPKEAFCLISQIDGSSGMRQVTLTAHTRWPLCATLTDLSTTINRLKRKYDTSPQKQEFGSPIPASVPSAVKHMLFYPSHDSNRIMTNSK